MKDKGTQGFVKNAQWFITDAPFKGVSVEVKLPYGLMLDGISLSQKNRRYDNELCLEEGNA